MSPDNETAHVLPENGHDHGAVETELPELGHCDLPAVREYQGRFPHADPPGTGYHAEERVGPALPY